MAFVQSQTSTIPTLHDLLHELDLVKYHSAFLESGATEGSVVEMLEWKESDLKSTLQMISMLPFHKTKFEVGIRQLREKIKRQQQQDKFRVDYASSNYSPMPLTSSDSSDSTNYQPSSFLPTHDNGYAPLLCSFCQGVWEVRDFGYAYGQLLLHSSIGSQESDRPYAFTCIQSLFKICLNCNKLINTPLEDAVQPSSPPTFPHGYEGSSSTTSIYSSVNKSANSSYSVFANQPTSTSFDIHQSTAVMDEPLKILGQHSSNTTMSLTSQFSQFDSQSSGLEGDGVLDLNDLSEASSSLPSTSPFNSMSTLGSTESTDDLTSLLYELMGVSSSCRRKCDRCSTEKIRCSGTFPCRRCRATGKTCTLSRSRTKKPGTCKECTRRKVPCIGDGDICFACKDRKTPHLCIPESHKRNSNSTSDDNFSEDPFGKHGRKDDSDNNKGSKKRAATNSRYKGKQSEISGSDVNSSSSIYQWNGQNSCRMAYNLLSLVPIYSIEDCVIGHRIGSGASMQVFEGTCIIGRITTRVAFRRPREYFDKKKMISLIWRELIIMRRLKSCLHIVDFHGLTLDRLTPVIIVELAKCSLDSYLSNARQRHCPISWIEKVRLCCDICEGLLALHSAEILHGDIKASNVLVFFSKDNGSPIAKISDFGFSSKFTSPGNNEGGTPAFAAPECTSLGLATHPELLNWRRDKYQDIYSYGLVLWQVAMDGEVPYNGLSRFEIEAAKTREPELTELKCRLPPDTPQALRSCIELATSYMPQDRAFLDDLRNILLLASQPSVINSLQSRVQGCLHTGNLGNMCKRCMRRPGQDQTHSGSSSFPESMSRALTITINTQSITLPVEHRYPPEFVSLRQFIMSTGFDEIEGLELEDFA